MTWNKEIITYLILFEPGHTLGAIHCAEQHNPQKNFNDLHCLVFEAQITKLFTSTREIVSAKAFQIFKMKFILN